MLFCCQLTFFSKSTFSKNALRNTRVHTGLKSTSVYRTVLKIKFALKSTLILPFTGGFNTVFGDLNQYKLWCLYLVQHMLHHNIILIFSN